MSSLGALPSPGSRLGAYVVLEELGRGGMGAVYRARDERLDRLVALKVLLADRGTDARSLERFRLEALAGARIRHPNVVALHEAGTDGAGRPWLAFEHVSGGTLKERLREAGGRLPWREAALLGAGIARGLAAIHAAGLVHRDLKPANVLLDGGRAMIADLGVARGAGDAGTPLTRTSDVIGTAAYMAPEQLDEARAVDARADLYALGATLYELLTGRPPFEGSPLEIAAALVLHEPEPLGTLAPDVPAPLALFVHRLLAKRPEERGGPAADVALTLERLAGPAPPRPAPPLNRRRLAGAGLVLAAAALVALVSRQRPADDGRPPPSPAPAPVAHPRGDADRSPPRLALADPELPPEPVPASLAVSSDEPLASLRANGREVVLAPPESGPWRVDVPGDIDAVELVGRDAAGNASAPLVLRRFPAALRRGGTVRIDGGTAMQLYTLELPERSGTLELVHVPRGGTAPVGFWIARHETTWGAYDAFCERTRRAPPDKPDWLLALGDKEGHPAVCVTWEDARAFCRWAGLDLPTASQWMRAAGAADGRPYPWGTAWGDAPRANVCDRSCPENLEVGGRTVGAAGYRDETLDDGHLYTAPAGSYPLGASPFGALDLLGNAAEWCRDRELRGGSHFAPHRRELSIAFHERGYSYRSDAGFRGVLVPALPGAPPRAVAPPERREPFRVGDAVAARWGRDGRYYAATIAAIEGKTVRVRYDDGDAATVGVEDLVAMAAASGLSVGDPVFALHHGARMDPGRVESVSAVDALVVWADGSASEVPLGKVARRPP